MNDLLKLELKIEDQLRIEQVTKISQLAKSYNGKIYLITKKKHVINAANLPALITYLLMVKSGQKINVVIDGPYPQLKLNDLTDICSATERSERHTIIQPAVKAKI